MHLYCISVILNPAPSQDNHRWDNSNNLPDIIIKKGDRKPDTLKLIQILKVIEDYLRITRLSAVQLLVLAIYKPVLLQARSL